MWNNNKTKNTGKYNVQSTMRTIFFPFLFITFFNFNILTTYFFLN